MKEGLALSQSFSLAVSGPFACRPQPAGCRLRFGLHNCPDPSETLDSASVGPPFGLGLDGTRQPAAATAALVPVCTSTREGLTLPRIVLARAMSAAEP